ncbi:MAG: hypothetical protein IMF12_06475, partial [Proteobacteria bacterium]|nr:hypothetical protein [Pseudomonadota bacterium]
MSLLMDALKKADEAVDTPSIGTPPVVPDKKDWDDELLPQFQIDSQTDIKSESVDDTPIPDNLADTPEKWDEEFLPQFQNDQVKNSEIADAQNNIVESDDVQADIAKSNEKNTDFTDASELIKQPSPTEIKLSNTDNLKNVDEIQNLFSLTDKEHKNSEKTEELQIPVLDINEQSPLEEPVEEPEYRPQDAQRIFTATTTPPKSSKRTIWLVSILSIVLVSMGSGYYYFQDLLNQTSSIKFDLSKRPKFNPEPNPVSIEQSAPIKKPTQQAKPIKIVANKLPPVKAPVKIKPVTKIIKPIPKQTPKAKAKDIV